MTVAIFKKKINLKFMLKNKSAKTIMSKIWSFFCTLRVQIKIVDKLFIVQT